MKREFFLMKRCLLLLATFLLALALCDCSNSASYGDDDSAESSSSRFIESENDSLEDMVRIHAKGDTAILGTMEKDAKQNEKPQMKVVFTYDFSIARREVTCDEYNSLMENKVKCLVRNLPVTNVTYYDAVLMANARSKKENFDTVYTYENTRFDYGGHCVGLDGFSFHPEVDGYRLPTEAEWNLVAMQGWSYTKAWTVENAEYRKHMGCKFPPNGVTVCDMVGNVMEWVNDWLGYFRDTTVMNFVGAPDGGGVGERIVKGGSYRDVGRSIVPSSRGDVYMVSSATKQEYIGFRLAFGAIDNPTWMDRSGTSVTSRVVPMASTSTLLSATGASKARLVLRNDMTGNLVYITYTSALPTAYEFEDSIDVYHPDISPDGKWVAFCTGVEGITGTSEVYVRNLDSVKDPAIKLDVPNAAIPRWRVENGDTVIVYVSDAGNNAEQATFMQKSTWKVSFAGGKFGTPQKLFDGAYHDGISSDNRLAVTGSTLLRARIAESGTSLATDTVWYGGEQACNASLAKDGTNRVSFLDFGGETGRTFVGKRYGTHERILIADSTGKLLQTVAAPSGSSFDHSEWAGDGLVAAQVNANGAHTKVLYINLQDSSFTTLAEGDEIWHPCLWLKKSDSPNGNTILDLDSAGVYYRETSEDYVFVFREKMEQFWTMKDSITVLAMGSSRTMFGLYYKEMPSWVVLNMAYPGADMYDARYILLNYILDHVKTLKYLILEVAPDMFYRQAKDHWIPMYTSVPGIAYDAHHGFWRDGVPEGFIEAVKNCPSYANKDILPYDADFMYPAKSWGNAPLVADSTLSKDSTALEWVETSFAAYTDIVEAALDAGIKIVGVIYPRHPDYRKTGSFGAYGPMRSYAEKIINRVSKFDMVILDENKWGYHDYTNEMAYDYDHLSIEGAKQLTRRVDSLLKTLE